MNKSFAIAVVVGIFALLVFAYFIFGLNQSNPSYQSDSSYKTVPPTQPTLASNEQLKIEDITVGTGKEVKSGDTVVIHYKGTLTDGTVFDSSYERNEPYTTPIGAGVVIQGWDEGVVGMKVGGKRKLTIPPNLGYGSQPSGKIPANSTLIFELELVDIK